MQTECGTEVRSRVKSKMGNAWENLSCEGVVPNYKHVCTKLNKFLTVVKPSTVAQINEALNDEV